MKLNIDRMRVASLSSEQLEKIQSLESELGYLLLALQPKYSIADLDNNALDKVKKLEEDLGIVLLAYQE